MAIITLPTKFAFTSVESFRLQRSSNTLRSRYTGQRQTILFPFAVWFFEGTLVEYDGVDAAKIRSFLTQLEGQKNSFRLPVPGYSGPSTGYAANTTLTLGGVAARALSFNTYGNTNNAAVLNEGDFFTINDELKVATAAIAANGAGQATYSFQPPMRKAVGGDTQVKLQNPTCLMNALEDDVAGWSLKAPVRHGITLSAVEEVGI